MLTEVTWNIQWEDRLGYKVTHICCWMRMAGQINSYSPLPPLSNTRICLSQGILRWLDGLPIWYHMAFRYCLPKGLMQDWLTGVPLEAQWVTPCFYHRHISVPGWEIRSQYCVVQSGGGGGWGGRNVKQTYIISANLCWAKQLKYSKYSKGG